MFVKIHTLKNESLIINSEFIMLVVDNKKGIDIILSDGTPIHADYSFSDISSSLLDKNSNN